jgi:hypothetical protein
MKLPNENSLSKDDENLILSLAERIKKRRLLEKQFESFQISKNISIRWDASYKDFGFSYCSVIVTAEEVERIVREKLNLKEKE